MMSAITKKLHVHFQDDLANSAASDVCADDGGPIDRPDTLNYSRQELLMLRNCSSAQVAPIFFDEMNEEGEVKRREKINFLVRTSGSAHTKSGENVDLNALWRGDIRRTTDSTWDNRQHALPRDAKHSGESGVDLRYMNNEFFDQRKFAWDGNNKTDYRNQFGREYTWNRNRNHNSRYSRNSEPEWMHAGPISKNDVMELKGFHDDKENDVEKFKGTVKDKTNDDGKNGLGTPTNSTPSKSDATNARKDLRANQKNDEKFNFEDFLKFDLAPNSNGVRDMDKGESRFSHLFRKDSPSKHSYVAPGESADSSANHFFELMQRTKGKKTPSNLVSMSSQFLSVEDLEADLCASNRGSQKPNQEPFRKFMNQLGNQKSQPSNPSFNLQEILNKNAHDLFQYQRAQEQILRRHNAQIILHRLSCNDISLLHVLQELGNPSITPYDRDTLMAIVNYCNGHNRIQQTLKQKQQVVNQFRNMQINSTNGGTNPFIQRPPTPQELQLHTQSILKNALLKKQLEQFHLVQQMQLNGGDSTLSNLLQQATNAQKMQQQMGNPGMPPNVYKKPYVRKTSGFQHQQHQPHQPHQPHQSNGYQSSKQSFGRKITPQNSFTLSPVVQKKWSNTQQAANINVADAASVDEKETAGSDFDQAKEMLHTSSEVDK